ncbi:hypothetical protein [Dyadobacter psychrotolerans]|uniref:Uncharacterized protein n=1 Tax=Dyadobacter psychrotolerans TaxID=2541721 RepID=A0A4R5DJW3_9BACT|nr:hypothetical protein [Dyadobacter psychrotolerans]TDE14426.1 hypothetical protein E0F88_14590 [Dyadobacter psychrotolerans]
MKQTYKTGLRNRNWTQVSTALILTGLFALAFHARAQEGSQGNTTIFGGAQMTFFGNHDFAAPAGGTQPGVILTERATASMSYLNYSGNNLTASGVTDVSYVDGYVRKYGTGQFIFPTGDNGFAGQFAASADGTSGAYFHTDATTAITSNLFTGGSYPVLPAGGPFATTSVGAGVGTVSTIEYWDIDGATATPITLTWDAGSNISTLTGGTPGKLTIVGWNPATSKWEALASAIDATSVLGGPSDINQTGSITSTASIVPNTYTAYTFASVGTIDLTPTLPRPFVSALTLNQEVEGVLRLSNLKPNPTTGLVTVYLELGSGFLLTSDPAAATSGGLTVTNGQWNITDYGGTIEYISKPGTIIAAGSTVNLGYKVKATGTISSTGIITATIINQTGGITPQTGDDNDNNNVTVKVFSIIP